MESSGKVKVSCFMRLEKLSSNLSTVQCCFELGGNLLFL